MAIWQYDVYFLPEEELNSYFPQGNTISEDAFNEIDWWKYRHVDRDNFAIIRDLLPAKKSWSDGIIQFGNLESDCFEILTEFGKVVEVSARIDLRLNSKYMIKLICQFGRQSKLIFLINNQKYMLTDDYLLHYEI